MKKILSLFTVAGLLAAPSMYASYSVTLTLAGGNANGGGMFHAVTSPGNPGPGNFNTFCISIGTVFNPGNPYYFTETPTVAQNFSPPAYNYVSLGTAYIYNQFLAGNSTYGGTLNAATLNNVQAAIWYLQGELVAQGETYSHPGTGISGANNGSSGFYDPENGLNLAGLANPILTQLQADTGKTLLQLVANGNSIYGIEALNLYSNSGLTGVSQPQLVQIVPEPTTLLAGALMMLPFGASTLRALRKKSSV